MTGVKSYVTDNLELIEHLDKADLLELVRSLLKQGISLNFSGKRTAQIIQRKVRPRTMRQVKALHIGTEEEQARNLLIEGENLQALVTLHRFRGEVDLILTDPPYNTGQDFRYNDKWDTDPNDPELGHLVTKEDGSRHTKWMKFMLPRLHQMRDMLKSTGVIAICIDDNEFFHLGMMMDEVFGEANRVAIINWQKAYAPKNDSRHVSTATEYVLIYAKDKTKAKTGLTERTEAMNAKYSNPDNDPHGDWRTDNAISRDRRDRDRYGIQSPFTGAIHYPGAASWRLPRTQMKAVLEHWGCTYIEKDIKDGRSKAFIIKGGELPKLPETGKINLDDNPVVEFDTKERNLFMVQVQQKATKIRDERPWPGFHFGAQGMGRPTWKRYLKTVKKGKVPLTYWADEDYDTPLELGTQSWDYADSGHSQTGINELNAIVGKGHNFDTVKPLKLFEKIILLWCRPDGIVLDPFAGSGTTGHAVLDLNHRTGSKRRFILIEQGRPSKGDKYARSLTHERLRRVIEGVRAGNSGEEDTTEALGGGFSFYQLLDKVDAKALLNMRREELIDVVLASHYDSDRKKAAGLIRIDPTEGKYQYLFGRNDRNEGYYMIWEDKDTVGQLDEDTYDQVLAESRKAGLKAPHHVYARYEIYQSTNVRFYQIPDRILMHLGFNEFSDAYNNPEGSTDD
ncbi:site-specific DNA-methyltransferase [Deinococcus taklimakanensis]|uniref:Site-specific DNA-methyltransferase n=1 Tax=Deinococcus taklimakanensis TaxID=536443 RepID=A0ABW5NY01_9DEIO